MYDVLFTVHMLGLALGAGTGFYMAALGAYAARSGDRSQIKAVMFGPGGVIARVGFIGLVLMVVSGAGMLAMMGSLARFGWAFWTKMALVAVLVVFLAVMKRLSLRAQRETGPEAMLAIKRISPVGPALAVLIISFAVAAFR